MMDFQEIYSKIYGYVSHLMGEKPHTNDNKLLNKYGFLPLSYHHFLSTILPYESFDTETSLFINKKSIGFVLETTPLLGSNQEIENILTSIINDILPANMDMQFLLWTSPKIAPMLDSFEDARSKNDVFSWLAKKRTEYLREGAHTSLSKSGTLLLRDIRTFIVVSSPKKFVDNREILIGLRDDIESSLKSINVGSRSLHAQQFIETFFDIITPSKNPYPHNFKWNEYDSLASQLTNSEWKLQVNSSSLQFHSENEEREVICLSVKDYPDYPTQWKTAENLGQLFNATLQIPCPTLISFSLRKTNQEKASTSAQLNTMNKESTANSPLAKFKPSVRKEYSDWQFVRNRLGEGETLVKTFYQVILFTQLQDSKFCEQRVRNLYQANGWKLRKESYLQLQSFLASFPMVMSEGMFDDLKYFGRLKTMTSFNAINLAPLQGEWKGTRSPGLLLPGRRGQIALWTPFDNDAGNYNIAITAAPGKGKSVLVQEMIVSNLSANGQVVVIDQGHSQQKTCKLLKGQFIEFTPNNPICLNPFSFITDINESIVMLKPMIATMARPLKGASEEEMSYIEQAIKAAYEEEGNDASILHVSNWLAKNTSEISKNLAHLLYSYTEGVYKDIYVGKCSIDFSNPFIVWELLGLKAKKDLRRNILQLIIYQTSQKMFQSDRTRIKSCIIDEAWDLFDDDNIAAGKFIEAGYRTARKFRGNFISIAHSIADFHKNPMSKAAYDCSDFKIILGQTDEAINKLKHEKIMDIDGFTERLLKSLKLTNDYSECVIKSPEGMSVHRIVLDPYSRILFSTKGEEFDAVNQLVESNVPITNAIEQVARKFGHV